MLFLPACGEAKKEEIQKTESVEQEIQFRKDGRVDFLRAAGTPISSISVERADNEYAQTMGLMFRKHMENDQGMLFIFRDETIRSFWMKNTILSLDMIFVNSAFEIVDIHKNTTPYSEQSYTSSAPAKYVVEVNAGYTDQFQIKVGDKIRI